MFLRTQEVAPIAEEEHENLMKQEEQNNGNNECPEEHGAEVHVS
jgi:hypothetical protein